MTTKGGVGWLASARGPAAPPGPAARKSVSSTPQRHQAQRHRRSACASAAALREARAGGGGVRPAQGMRAGPCIPVRTREYCCKGLQPAELRGGHGGSPSLSLSRAGRREVGRGAAPPLRQLLVQQLLLRPPGRTRPRL
jgi:hypothetical protein